MGLVVQKHVTIELLIFDKTAMTYLPYWPEVGTCGAAISLAISLAPQLFLNGCADACAASILAILSAIASQIRL